MTALDGVNEILRKAGGYPVSMLDATGASAASEAQRSLIEANRKIQIRGWNFNTRRNVELTPNTQGIITLPDGTLHLDTSNKSVSQNITHRGERVYDLDNNTEVFTGPIRVTLIELWEFHCVPEPVANHIVVEAAMCFNSTRGDPRRSQYIYMESTTAQARAMVFNSSQADHNFLGSADALDVKGNRRTSARSRY